MIEFNKAPYIGREEQYLSQAIQNGKLCGDGPFTRLCSAWMQERFGAGGLLLTTSCTHALEMSAFLAGIQPGDEVIMPSYTFVSSANAFVLRGAKIVFVDIRPDTMNLDERLLEEAVTERTRAIVPVHYAGVACAMDEILAVARKHRLTVIEDAAQGVRAYYKGRALGTIGDFGCYSFHETKNYTMGEGGAILFRDPSCRTQAEILREKGTNRAQFFRGQIDKYTWIGYGSSYLPSDLNAAYLYAQLLACEEIQEKRMRIWNLYRGALSELEREGRVELPVIPPYAEHNAHMFYLKAADLEERTRLIAFLKERGIMAVFHYVPLHSSPAGRAFGRFAGEDVWTTRESERLLRLPLFYNLPLADAERVAEAVLDFYRR